MKFKILLLILIPSLVGLSLFGVIDAYAQTSSGGYSSIVTKLAQKFGLKEADVKAVFDQNMTERLAAMKTRFEDRLAQAVKDGKITEAQKSTIVAKKAELEATRVSEREKWKTETPAARRADRKKEHDDLQVWAKQNNIDLSWFFGFSGPHRGPMKGMGFH